MIGAIAIVRQKRVRCLHDCGMLLSSTQKEVSGLHELAAGGVIYVVGVVFFKCDGVIPFAHAIWHSFVFIGAGVHFVAVCRHLLGPAAAVELAVDLHSTGVHE